jgi:MFS family permease
VTGDVRARDSARAWVVVGAAFAALFTVFGVTYSFGAFFEPISAEFGTGRGASSVVFSLTSLLFFTLGVISGPASDRFGPRPLLLVGAAAFGAGLVATAAADRLWVAYLTYGVGVGVGVGCVYAPMLATVGGWFERRRALALGVTVSGIGLGILVAAPLSARLIDAYGWRTTYVIFAVAGAVVLALSAVLVSAPPSDGTTVQRGTGAALRTREYRWLYLSNVLLCLVLFVPFVHLPTFAEDAGLGATAAAGLVGLIGAASIVGRIALGGIADRAGPLLGYRVSFLLIGVSFALWWIGDDPWSLVAFAVVLGVGYGGYVALTPVVLAALFGVDRLGGLLGILLTANAVGSAVGPPAVGLAVDATGGYGAAVPVLAALGLAAFAALLPLGRYASKLLPEGPDA